MYISHFKPGMMSPQCPVICTLLPDNSNYHLPVFLQQTFAGNSNDYGTLRPGDIEASDIEATTLRPGDIEARRHWGQATLRPGDIEARRLWGQICMSNFPKPKHWPQSRDFEANVWPRSRDDVEARRRWGQICMGNYPKERMGCREHIYCTNVQKMQSLSKWKKITSRKW